MNKKYIPIIILAAIFLILSGFFLWKWETDKNLLTNQLNESRKEAESYKTEKEALKIENSDLKEKMGETMLPEQVSDKVTNYINENLLSSGSTATFVSINEASALYKINFKVGNNSVDVYASKDGKLLFIQGAIDMKSTAATKGNQAQGNNPPAATCENLAKNEEAFLEAFVVSNCPYGLQMQRVLGEIIKNIPSMSAYIEVRYMGAVENGKITSMHGDNEAQENLRQICIREEQNSKYWNYLSCYLKKGETDSCLASVNIDQASLSACMSNSSRGLEYAKNDFDLQDKLGVSGSPTLFLNKEKVNEFDFGGRTAEAVKTLLCCGFDTEPGTCSKKLTETNAATGFSEAYTSSSGSSSNGGCQ